MCPLGWTVSNAGSASVIDRRQKYTIFEGTSEIQRIVISQALGASEGAPPLHIEIEPSGGPLNRMFGRGTPLRSRVADVALSAKDRVPEPMMRLAMKVLQPPRK